MGKETGIAWCDHTYNPWWGCVKKLVEDGPMQKLIVDPACENCYAETWSARPIHDLAMFGRKGERGPLPIWGQSAPRRFFDDKHWREPLQWAAAAQKDVVREKVFCGSMMDVFELHRVKEVAMQMHFARQRLWDVIEQTGPWGLDWLLLTKRPENVLDMVPLRWKTNWPRYAWLGTSTATKREWELRIPILKKIPARVKFVSWEPAIGPIHDVDPLDLGGDDGVNWLIAGCESDGSKLGRPAQTLWFREALLMCRLNQIPFFLKQIDVGGKLCKDPSQFPADLRVQEFPR